MDSLDGKSIVFFDGVCIFCNDAVNFIIKHDRKKQFLFSPLQSEFAINFLKRFPIPEENDSILLYENDALFDRSTAALKIAKKLNGVVKFSYYLIYIPRFIRDYIYQIIANNRYQWFGKKKQCMVPDERVKQRFVF